VPALARALRSHGGVRHLVNTWRYAGRLFTERDLSRIRDVVAQSPPNRAALARDVCAALDWRRPTGEWKTGSCIGVLLRMHRDGLIVLPPPSGTPPVPRGQVPFTAASARQAPITGSRRDLGPLSLTLVQTRTQAQLWRELIARWHYLGYSTAGGPNLRYFVHDSQQRPLALLGFSAAAWKVGPRDRFIGWNPEQRSARLPYLVNLSRFLILPWVRVRFLASSLLAVAVRQIPAAWEDRYGTRPLLFETFVDSHRFSGTCFRAAGWLCLGETAGRGKYDRQRRRTHRLPERWVFVRPLDPHFRRTLNAPLINDLH